MIIKFHLKLVYFNCCLLTPCFQKRGGGGGGGVFTNLKHSEKFDED